MQKKVFSDAVLNRMAECADDILNKKTIFCGKQQNQHCEGVSKVYQNTLAKRYAQTNKEKNEFNIFVDLLECLDCNELSDIDLYNFQTLCLNVLDAGLKKGYIDGVERLLQTIGLGLIERGDVFIDEKECIVEESLFELMRDYAKFTRYSFLNPQNQTETSGIRCVENNQTLYLGKTLIARTMTYRAKGLLKNVSNGKYGRWLKGDYRFCEQLAYAYNEYMNTSNASRSLEEDVVFGETYKQVRLLAGKERVTISQVVQNETVPDEWDN